MARDISVVIPLEYYQCFQAGSPIKVLVRADEPPRTGSKITWECGSQHRGQALVLMQSPSERAREFLVRIRKLH
jgi:hypothetical protein